MTYATDLMLQRFKDSTSFRTSLPASTSSEHTDNSGPSDMSEIQNAVRAHNKARIPRECPIMQWDAELAAMASEYARILAISDKLERSGVQGQGENLYASAAESNYIDAVEVWLADTSQKKIEEEVENLGHFSRPETIYYVALCSTNAGFAAQCVWHSTTHLGMGKAKSKSGLTYVVARYTPPGNIVGQKPYEC
ncbi:uncharacterized protein RCC_11321 [Ramularia collo-cygni]|uniref:SCP domain-containing protein n=1 Tax=Ramularia collo-cygni TaxID=112498 RepID=A0A2D3V5R9_9PEZI|nr:uncharacterized protein RCC_11321 [Ramularia collo-cygni]CZT25652.1 uncharacterized protein RCC_11321 [Ramularia collo-cygni]